MEQEFNYSHNPQGVLSFTEFLQRKYNPSNRQSFDPRQSTNEKLYPSYHQNNDSISELRTEIARASNIVQRINSPINQSINKCYMTTQQDEYVQLLKKYLKDSVEEATIAKSGLRNLEVENLNLKRSIEEIKVNLEKGDSMNSDRVESLESQVKKKQGEVDELLAALSHNVKINKTLEENCGNYEKIIVKMKESMELLSKQNALSQQQHKKELQERPHPSNNNSELIAENTKLKNELDEKSKMLVEITHEIGAKEEIFNQITQMKEDVEDYAAKLEEMAQEITMRDEIIEKLKKLLDEKIPVQSKPDEYKKKYEEEVEKNKILLKKLEDIKPFIEELIGSKDKMKEAFEKSVKEMGGGKLNEALVKENKELKGINELLISKMDGLPELEKKFQELFNEIIKLRTENAALKAELGQVDEGEQDGENGEEEQDEEEEEIDNQAEEKKITSNSSQAQSQITMKQQELSISPDINFYSIYDSSIICYNLSKSKFTKVNAQGMKSFLTSYQPNGSIYHNTLQGLFIVTGQQFNELFYLSQKTQELNKIIAFRENHQHGAMLLSEESKKVIVISGNHTNAVECLQIDQGKICSLPSLSQKRTKTALCFIDKILYMFFGLCPDTNKCISTIEYLDINSTDRDNKWKVLELKSMKGEFDLVNHSVLNVNDQEILILGGTYENGSCHEQMIYFNFPQKTMEKIRKPLGQEYLKETHLFNKNGTFKDYLNGSSLGFANMDDLNNIHLIDSQLHYHLIKFNPSTLG